MTDNEILEKAIQKAIDGGWKSPLGRLEIDKNGVIIYDYPGFAHRSSLGHETIIFNHDFAKALWPSELYSQDGATGMIHPWRDHLQAMVIAEDPIKYLGENI